MGEIVSKGRFAELCNVSPGRVSQWLVGEKITGAAIVGEGRFAKIDVDLAKAQLKKTLDVDQAHSGNGLPTNLEADPAVKTTTDKIAEQRLQLLTRQNQQAEVDAAAANGQLVSVDDARRATGKEVAAIVSRVEGALPGFANAIAAKFKLPARDIHHELKAHWRQVRADGAIEARERAEPLPEAVGFDLDPDRQC